MTLTRFLTRKLLLWLLLAGLCAIAVISCQSNGANSTNARGNIDSSMIARPAYGAIGELFQNEIIRLGLSELGYAVTEGMEVEYQIFHEAIARGYLEYTASHWNSLHEGYFSEDEATLARVGTLINDAWQGYLIDSDTAERSGINNLQQLQDPQLARLFDIDGNGKADLIGCDRGWGCHAVIEHHLDEYGLRGTVEHRFGEYDDLIKKQVMPRQEQGQPILYYTWAPYWVSGVLRPGDEVVRLEVPFTTVPAGAASSVPGVLKVSNEARQTVEVTEAETTFNGRNLGFPVDRIQILANQTFLDNHPDAAEFFRQATLPIRDVNIQNRRMVLQEEMSFSNVRSHAREWVEKNRELFDGWIQQARQAA